MGLDWLVTFPPGRSITELEMQCALRGANAGRRAFFALRSPDFVNEVPDEYLGDFAAENPVSKVLLDRLKHRVRTSDATVLDAFEAKWGGKATGKPAATGLEVLGDFFLNALWGQIAEDFGLRGAVGSSNQPQPQPGPMLSAGPTEAHVDQQQSSFVDRTSAVYVGRESMIKRAVAGLEAGTNPVVVVHGAPGSGKTAFLCEVARRLADKRCPALYHFVGATPESSGRQALLKRLCRSLAAKFGIHVALPETVSGLRSCFGKLLAAAAERTPHPISVLVDGIDQLDANSKEPTIDWIPDPVPAGVVFAVSASNVRVIKALRERSVPPVEHRLGSLAVRDRENVVRAALARYKKVLDESAFNNQMRLLVSKADAKLPLYLSVACEELRIFAVYEQLSEHIAKLPGRLAELFDQICARLETDLGVLIVSACFTVLACSRSGLDREGLVRILCHGLGVETSRLTVLRLWRSLAPFLGTFDEVEGSLRIDSEVFRAVIDRRYFRGSQSATTIHHVLATHFKRLSDPTADGQYLARDASALLSLAFHQIMGMQWRAHAATLSSLQYIQAMFATGLKFEAVAAYVPRDDLPRTVSAGLARTLDTPALREFGGFVTRNADVLTTAPILTVQQAVNEPASSAPHRAATATYGDSSAAGATGTDVSRLRWLNKPSAQAACELTIGGNAYDLTALCVSPDGALIATSDAAGTVITFNPSTGETISSFVAHAGAISDICFVGKETLCTAGWDLKVALWSARHGAKKAERSGFTRRISALSAAADGSLVAACSWDGSVKCFRGKDGNDAGMHHQGSPANTVAFAPDNRTIAIGYWDASITIWDAFDNTVLGRLSGHRQSVQSVSWSPDGVLLSCALDGTAKLWSPKAPYSELESFDAGKGNPVTACAFSTTGSALYTAVGSKVTAWQSSPGQLREGFAGSIPIAPATAVSAENPNFLVVGFRTGVARLLTPENGEEVAVFDTQNPTAIRAVAAAPTRALVVVSSGNGILVHAPRDRAHGWGLVDGIQTASHRMVVTAVALNDDGLLASAAEDGTINLAHIPMTGPKAAPSSTAGHDNAVTGLCFVPGAKNRLISVCKDGSMAHWKCGQVNVSRTGATTTCSRQQMIGGAHDDWINAVAIAAAENGTQTIATASNDCSIKLWRYRGMKLHATLHGHVGAATSVSFLSAELLISTGVDDTVRLWSVEDGAALITLVAGTAVATVAGNGARAFFAGSGDGLVRYDLSLGRELAAYEGHEGPVCAMALGPNGRMATCGRDDKAIKLWKAAVDADTAPSDAVHRYPVTSITIAPSAVGMGGPDRPPLVCSGDAAGGLRCWRDDAVGGRSKGSVVALRCDASRPAAHASSVTGIAVVRGEHVVTAGEDGALRVWTASLALKHTLTLDSPQVRLAGAAGGDTVASGGWDGTVRLFTVDVDEGAATLQECWSCVVGPAASSDWISGLRFSDCSAVLTAATINGTVTAFPLNPDGSLGPAGATTTTTTTTDAKAEGCFRSGAGGTWLSSIESWGAVSARRTPYVAAGGTDGFLHVWDRDHGGQVGSRRSRCHRGPITATALLPPPANTGVDGTAVPKVVTGSTDGALRIWDVGGPGPIRQAGEFACRAGCTALAAVVVDGGGAVIAAGDSQGNVYLLKPE